MASWGASQAIAFGIALLGQKNDALLLLLSLLLAVESAAHILA